MPKVTAAPPTEQGLKKKPSKAKASQESPAVEPKKESLHKQANKILRKKVKGEESPSVEKPTVNKLGERQITKKELKAKPREVLYAEPHSEILYGDTALTGKLAKELLGWREASEGMPFTNDYDFKNEANVKVKLLNNVTNRRIRWSQVDLLMQEILRHRWQLNGENIIIGKTGLILNGQHTLIALARACELWDLKQGEWRTTWPEPPTIDKCIVFGIEETDDVVNTLDTGIGRSLTDVLYRSVYFSKLHKKHRAACARIADHAVRMMWLKTGAGMDAMAPKRTHAESLDFIERHPRLLECVKHIFEEDGDDHKISTHVLSCGYAAAVMYLQASCLTESDKEDKSGYADAKDPDESYLDMSMFEKAEEFWHLIATGDTKLHPVRAAISAAIEEGGCGYDERIGIITNAWNNWTANKKLTLDNVKIDSDLDLETGVKSLIDVPRLGGIDIG